LQRNFNNNGNFDFALIRYNPDGAQDNTFGINGKAAIDFEGSQDLNLALALQTDGIVIAAGTSTDGFSLDFAVARYNALFPIIDFSAENLQFGNVKVDSTVSKKFIIRNTGSAPCIIDSMTNKNDAFTVTAEN
jgi:hypothetical protein